MDVCIAAIFDRDYRSDAEVDEFVSSLSNTSLLCRVLGRKEIENYALHLGTLQRAIERRAAGRISSSDAAELIERLLDEMHDDVRDRILGSYLQFHRKLNPKINDVSLIADCMRKFDRTWDIKERRLTMVPGKEFISALSTKLHQATGCSITLVQIVNEMRSDEIDPQLATIISDIRRFFQRTAY